MNDLRCRNYCQIFHTGYSELEIKFSCLRTWRLERSHYQANFNRQSTASRPWKKDSKGESIRMRRY